MINLELFYIISIIILLIINSHKYTVIKKLKQELQNTRQISWDRYVALTNAIEEKNSIKRDMLAMQSKLARYEERLNQNPNKENKDNEKEINS